MADEQNPTGGGAPPPTDTTPKVVALENFQAVVNAKNGLEAQVSTLKGQIQSLTEKAATSDQLAAQVREWQGKAEKAEQKFGTYTELSAALGSTSTKVIGIFDAEYGSLPEAERPSRKAWVDALKADPTTAPEHLTPWLTPAASAPVGGTGATAKPPAPRVPGTPATPPSAPSNVSAEEVRRVREEAVRTGNWGPWKDLRKAMGIAK